MSFFQNEDITVNLNVNTETEVSTISGSSRKMFDTFYRALLNGQNSDYPKPKVFKLARNQLFPERDLVFEWIYDKKNNGTWIPWTDIVDKAQIQLAPTAKVSQICLVDDLNCCSHEYTVSFIPLTQFFNFCSCIMAVATAL
jgi:dynein heavy chain